MIQKAIIKKERYSYDTTSILCPSGTSTFSHAGSGTAGNDPLLSGISGRCQRRRTCRTGHTGSLGQQILRENGISPQPAVIKHSNRTAKLIVLACTFYIWLPLLVTWYSLLLTP